MSEIKKDPGIMLFGRKIPLPECQILANSGAMEKQEDSCDLRDGKQDSQHNVPENVENSSGEQDKIMKKPDKILRCPRCKSMETKFCYFNNYNVNQPRHFCKSCQRYWTAGGTMRNVPIGAGRRKHKHLATQYRPESKDSSSVFSSSAEDNVSVLKFGPDTPLRESMESMLNLRDHKRCVDSSSINCAEYGEDSSFCGSSVTNVSSTQGNNESSEHRNKTPNWLQYYPYPPWILPWNPSNVPRTCTPSTIPVQLVPAYWSGTTPVMLGSGNGTVSIGSSHPSCISPSSSTSNSCCSENGSKTHGKHTRDRVSTDECVLAPKGPRIDEQNEASKSPMLVTLAIK